MTTETQQQYQAQILRQLIKNSQEWAVLQTDVEYLKDKTDRIDKDLAELNPTKDKVNWAEWWLIAIADGLIVSCFKEQIWQFLT